MFCHFRKKKNVLFKASVDGLFFDGANYVHPGNTCSFSMVRRILIQVICCFLSRGKHINACVNKTPLYNGHAVSSGFTGGTRRLRRRAPRPSASIKAGNDLADIADFADFGDFAAAAFMAFMVFIVRGWNFCQNSSGRTHFVFVCARARATNQQQKHNHANHRNDVNNKKTTNKMKTIIELSKYEEARKNSEERRQTKCERRRQNI